MSNQNNLSIPKPPVNFSTKASKALDHYANTLKIPEGYGLRIGVKGAGCGSGMGFVIGFDTKQDKDREFEWNGLPVFINPAHSVYFAGMTIDYRDDQEQTGFIFKEK